MTTTYAVVIPTIARPSLYMLLDALASSQGPEPSEVIIVDDRPPSAQLGQPLMLAVNLLPVSLLRSNGRGPAAARNVGWRAARADWICFLDDDVLPRPDWKMRLATDIERLDAAIVGSQGKIVVPPPERRPTDDERRTLSLASAKWITADMAYRRSALVDCGGFDERFRRAYREDADIALRLTRKGQEIVTGQRISLHPATIGDSSVSASVRAQRGNHDDALMRRKHGRGWRSAIGEGRGRLPAHQATVAAVLVAVVGVVARRRRLAVTGWAAWLGLTAEFAWRRIASGPRTVGEILAMAVSSIAIPPAAVAHRLRGTWRYRHVAADPPLAVLFDRDDTLIKDGPYLNDPAAVVPMSGASRALARLRRRGIRLGVVSNQSGVAKGLITADQLAAVNRRVDELLGPFDSWQVCVHDSGDACACRKPAPGMVLAAAADLEVDPRRCVVIGDTGGDVAAARAASARAILVPTARTRAAEVGEAQARSAVARTLNKAVSMVLRGLS